MRWIISLLLTISFFHSYAQGPEGRLYTLSYCGKHLGYVEYPGGNYVLLDSLGGTDLLVHKNRLFVAGNRFCQQVLQVYVYDLTSGDLDTVLAISEARSLAIWEDRLLVTSYNAPYLLAFDLNDDLRPVFSILDSSYLNQAPIDLVVWQDRAFLLLADGIAVVDLDLQDTLAIVATPPPLGFGGVNNFLLPHGSQLYFEVEYATGAIRSSLLRIDMQSLRFDTVYHAEGYANWIKPVVAEDDIYLYHFDSHYNIPGDSLYISPVFSQKNPLSYDPASQTFFLIGNQDSLWTWRNGQFQDTTILPGPASLEWFEPTSSTGFQNEIEASFSLQIFPNPTTERVFVRIEKDHKVSSIRLLNSKGQILQQYSTGLSEEQWEMDLSALSRGGYFVEVVTEDGIASAAVVKW